MGKLGPPNDHLFDLVLLDQNRYVVDAAEDGHTHDLFDRWIFTVDEANNLVAQARHLPDLLQDHAPHIAGTHDEKAVAPQTPSAEPVARHDQERATGGNQDNGQQPGIDDHGAREVKFQGGILEQERGRSDGNDRTN